MHPGQYPGATGEYTGCHRVPPGATLAATGRNWNESSHPGTGVEHLQTNGGYIPLWVRFTRGIQPGRLLGLSTPVPSRWQHRSLPGDAPCAEGRGTVPTPGALRSGPGRRRVCPPHLPGPAGGCRRSLPEPPAAEGGHPAVLPGALTVRAGWFPAGIPGPAGGCRGRPLRLYRACGRVSVREKGR